MASHVTLPFMLFPNFTRSSSSPLLLAPPSTKTILLRKGEKLRCNYATSDPAGSIADGDGQKQLLQLKTAGYKDDGIKERVERVKGMLTSMDDGDLTASPYDTAWVALVEAIDGSGRPQFPESLDWISKNQLEDGSWGDVTFFQAHDRLLNTLACVIALTYWNLHSHLRLKGIQFMRDNIKKLGEEKEEHMPIGFEVIFPRLIKMAQGLGIHLPPADDSGILIRDIYAKRSIKLSRITKEIMHRKATTLLFSLEGIEGLDWEQIMHLQSKNGSLLFSPASTAYALMHTNNLNCFAYLHNLVRRFKGGVPFSYPIDMLEHIWAVDGLQRLGISRYFEAEISVCLDYVYRYWSEDGIFSARESEVADIDDTCMGFRLLRLHGYHVSADVLKHFKNSDGEFMCFPWQSTESVTVMLNLYRASQLQFPGETILEEAREFSYRYLIQKQASNSNQLFDKWVIPKDLHGEVAYALNLPWYASLPRIESRFYIDQYGGEDDIWIGKTLYRMPNVSNNMYLELAKLDYNACQSLHLLEWHSVRRWYIDYNVGEFGLRQRELLRLYFVAAASVFEPERWVERLAWAKTWAMTTAIAAHFRKQSWASYEQRRIFVHQFLNSYNSTNSFSNIGSKGQGLVGLLMGTLNQVYLDVLEARGVDIRPHLRQAWEKWMVKWAEEGNEYKGLAELVALTILACSINTNNSDLELLAAKEEEDYFVGNYNLVLEAANKICHQIGHLILQNHNSNHTNPEELVNSHDLQRLLQLALSNDPGMKRTVLTVARAYYYSAYCSPETIDSHIAKLMFQSVD